MPPTTDPSTAPRLDGDVLESLFQSAGLAILACDAQARIVSWNAAATRLFGESGALAVGADVATLIPQEDRDSFRERAQRCMTAAEPFEIKVRLGGTDDDPIWFAVYVTAMIDADEVFRGMGVWFRDITLRVRLEREAKRHERLGSLGALSGAVAHHFNNLLCSIATSIEYTTNLSTVAAMRRALARAGDAVSRGAALTQQLLAFAQGDHRSFDLADFTETVLYFFDEEEPALSARSIRLLVDWERAPVTPIVREHLMIVLRNLVDNATDAMRSGGTLTVMIVRRDDQHLGLSIGDTGGGIPKEDMDHLFEPFRSTKAQLGCGESGKSGLGLAVVHGLVGEMGGTITAHNIPGRGARFDIIVPIRR
ncbi:MAG: PAS domain S-box protein [Phycisphaerales bacterium]|nr:PAS domain S-box protein [Phycisphaerales bacterium]